MSFGLSGRIIKSSVVTFGLADASVHDSNLTGDEPFELKAEVLDDHELKWNTALAFYSEDLKVVFTMKLDIQDPVLVTFDFEKIGCRGVQIDLLHPVTQEIIVQEQFAMIPFTGNSWEFCTVRQLIQAIAENKLLARVTFVCLKVEE